jgi:glycosyltransferase involved in cell wall biosynthesis
MKLAVGLMFSPGYSAPPQFWLGNTGGTSPEGAFPVVLRAMQLAQTRLITSYKFPTDTARNEICRAVLDSDEDYLLFLDADMVHPADLFERLVAHEKPVVTARYHLKKPPYNPVLYVKHRVLDGPHAYAPVHFARGLIEIERGGAGALLIRRDVIEAIARQDGARWREYHSSRAYEAQPDWIRESYLPTVPVVQWFRYQYGPEAPVDLSVSEDFWFYRRARELGFSTWADWDVECGHIHYTCVDSSHYDTSLDRQAVTAMQRGGKDWETWRSHAVVMGYPEGMLMPNGDRIPAYELVAGER